MNDDLELTDIQSDFLVEEHALVAESLEENTLKNVKLCGLLSENGAVYSRACFAEAAHMYNGIPVYEGHKVRGQTPEKRSIREILAQIDNAHPTEDGLRGDLHINPHHELAESLKWAHRTKAHIGLSPVHHCDYGKGRDGKRYVSKINKVYSCDIVSNPATCSTLTEETISVPIAKPVQTPAEIDALKAELAVLKKTVDDLSSTRSLLEESQKRVEELESQVRNLAAKPKVQSYSELPAPPEKLSHKVDRQSWIASLKGNSI